MNIKFLSAIAIVSVMAAAACSSGTGGSGGGGSNTGGGGATGGGGTAGGGTTGGGGTGGTSCHDCACASDSPCLQLCDSQTAGNLNFCTNGDTNGQQCTTCVATNCGETSLANCN
jgi:hypothetical protein